MVTFILSSYSGIGLLRPDQGKKRIHVEENAVCFIQQHEGLILVHQISQNPGPETY